MKKKFNLDLTTQNKLIIMALVFSTVLIILSSLWAMGRIKYEVDKGYRDLGNLLSKTLALQNYEITQSQINPIALSHLKAHVNSILASTNDISFISFKNQDGKIIYSTKDIFEKRTKPSDTKTSSQILDSNGKLVGTVEIGLPVDKVNNVTKTIKGAIFAIFSFIWLIFTAVILINALLIKRELTLLHNGVKEIEQGKFGTVLNYNQASGEVKELFDAFNDMSKKLHNYEEQNIDQLTLERNKLEAVLMSIANGVVVCDNHDKVSIINSSAQKILNVAQNQILNTSIQKYCDSAGEFCFKEKITIFKNTPLDVIEKKPLEFNINVDKRVIKSIISPMYSKMHDYLGYIIVLIDITKEAEVDRLKDDFISNVSHELRTPVTILSTYADTLYNLGSEFSYEEQKEFIGTINQEVVRLNKMVNDILDFSRLQSGQTLEKEKQDITLTIDKIAQSHKVLADEKNISITVIKEENLPKISYNAQSIERALSNLITNAIKYSNDNTRVKIRAEIARDPNYLEISVEDQGIGIAPEYQKTIFERFYRIENQVHTVKGTGLGLHLVKIAIEKHHQGKVFVKSKLNEGSTFSIWLPIDKNDVGAKKPQDYSVLDSFNYKTPQQLNEQNPQSTLNELSEAGQLNEYGAQGGQLQEKNYEEYKIEKIEDYSKKANFDAQFIGHNNEELQTIEQNKEIENNKENLFFEEFKKETIPSQNPINKANDLDNNQQKNVEFDNEIGKEIDKENGQETLLSQKTQQIQDEQGDWEISFEVRDN